MVSDNTPKPNALGLSKYSFSYVQNCDLLKRGTGRIRNLECCLLPQKYFAFRDICTCVRNWAAETSNHRKIILYTGYKSRFSLRKCFRVCTLQFLQSYPGVIFFMCQIHRSPEMQEI